AITACWRRFAMWAFAYSRQDSSQNTRPSTSQLNTNQSRLQPHSQISPDTLRRRLTMDNELKLPILILIVLTVFGLALVGCICYMDPDHIMMRIIRFLFFEGGAVVIQRNFRANEITIIGGAAVMSVTIAAEDASIPRDIDMLKVYTRRSRPSHVHTQLVHHRRA
ncbi:hypothetical protein JI435_077410, partial [Parastagonospora nodorum SN15]